MRYTHEVFEPGESWAIDFFRTRKISLRALKERLEYYKTREWYLVCVVIKEKIKELENNK